MQCTANTLMPCLIGVCGMYWINGLTHVADHTLMVNLSLAIKTVQIILLLISMIIVTLNSVDHNLADLATSGSLNLRSGCSYDETWTHSLALCSVEWNRDVVFWININEVDASIVVTIKEGTSIHDTSNQESIEYLDTSHFLWQWHIAQQLPLELERENAGWDAQ